MKRVTFSIIILLFVGICLLLNSCKKENVPTLTTSAITNITGTTATSGGTITNEGSGTITVRGVCWSTEITPTISDNKTSDGAGAGSFTSNISNLNGATLYYLRAYATNSAGTGYGMAMSFSTLGQTPSVTSLFATNVSTTGALLHGIVNANYLSADVTFLYGPDFMIFPYNREIVASQSPVSGNSNTSVSVNITGLEEGTPYNFTVKAINSLGTTTGNLIKFTTDLIDFDGNVYNIITIGSQVWFGENLRVTNYNDGSSILNATTDAEWANTNIGAYCWYNNSASYKNDYGGLYNWYAVSSGKLCPEGWRVPTDEDWTILTTYLGGENVAGGKLKETSISHWISPNTGATNETNFTALPGGARNPPGIFNNIGNYGFWWSASEEDDIKAWDRRIYSDNKIVERNYHNKNEGFSVRCLRDY